jgi:hypothetical protein
MTLTLMTMMTIIMILKVSFDQILDDKDNDDQEKDYE